MKINPLEQLIAIYGTKFADALKAGDLTKAIRMCADYQSPDTGGWLTYPDRVKAFAMRVSFEALKVPEIGNPAITINFTDEAFYMMMRDFDMCKVMYVDRNFERGVPEFQYMGVQMKRVSK